MEPKLNSNPSSHPEPLEQQKRRPWLGLVTFMVLLIVWEVISRISGWSAYIFPDPITVVGSLFELVVNGTLLRHTVASLYRVTAGFYMAILLGIPCYAQYKFHYPQHNDLTNNVHIRVLKLPLFHL